jgi:pentatricopeptide repeat protein
MVDTCRTTNRSSAILIRNQALQILERFRDKLSVWHLPGEVGEIVQSTLAELEHLQGTSPAHFAKSISQLACAVRQRGYVDQAVELLQWSMDRHVVDCYIVNELMGCYLVRGDVAPAEQLLVRACDIGCASDAVFAVLIRHYGRARNLDRVTALFEDAKQRKVAGEYAFTAVIHAYAKGGRLHDAQNAFQIAISVGAAGSGPHTSLIAAYGRRRDTLGAATVFEAAMANGVRSTAMYTAMLVAHARASQTEHALMTFHQAMHDGYVDERTYAAVIDVCARAGRLRQAQMHLMAACDRGLASEHSFLPVLHGYAQLGQVRQVHRLLRRARELGMASPKMRASVSLAHRKGSSLSRIRRRQPQVPRGAHRLGSPLDVAAHP